MDELPVEENNKMIEELRDRNTQIMWAMSVVGVALLLFWFACAYFVGGAEARKPIVCSSLVALIIGAVAAICMDKNARRIKELED